MLTIYADFDVLCLFCSVTNGSIAGIVPLFSYLNIRASCLTNIQHCHVHCVPSLFDLLIVSCMHFWFFLPAVTVEHKNKDEWSVWNYFQNDSSTWEISLQRVTFSSLFPSLPSLTFWGSKKVLNLIFFCQIPLRCSLFFCIVWKMNSLSNMIPFDFGLKNQFW